MVFILLLVQSKGSFGCETFGNPLVRQRQGKARRVVVLSIINITMEINFLSKVYFKSLLEVGLHDRITLSGTSLEEIISSPHNGYRYLSKREESNIFST